MQLTDNQATLKMGLLGLSPNIHLILIKHKLLITKHLVMIFRS